MCKILQVSYNAYHHWKNKPKVLYKRIDFLKSRIRLIFDENKGIYGAPRIKKILEKEGIVLSKSYISQLMRQMNLKSILAKKYVVTTDSSHDYKISDNKLNREFSSPNIGQKWVSDITYIKVGDHWNYLTVILDLVDRKVVGHHVSETMKTDDTILPTWNMARSSRMIDENFIFHSDRGIQYACNKIRNIFLHNKKITQSMSKKGDCWDNAVAESFFKTIKYEWLNRFEFDTSLQLNDAVDDYIQWYNTKRLHSTLGYKTPLEKQIELQKLKNYIKVA